MQRREQVSERERHTEIEREREKDAALCISMFAPRALIFYMLHYALLFICRDIEVTHEIAGCACGCV